MKITMMLLSAALVLVAAPSASAHPVCVVIDGQVVFGHDPCVPDATHVCITQTVSSGDRDVEFRTCTGI